MLSYYMYNSSWLPCMDLSLFDRLNPRSESRGLILKGDDVGQNDIEVTLLQC